MAIISLGKKKETKIFCGNKSVLTPQYKEIQTASGKYYRKIAADVIHERPKENGYYEISTLLPFRKGKLI